jgi:hypothetical protein
MINFSTTKERHKEYVWWDGMNKKCVISDWYNKIMIMTSKTVVPSHKKLTNIQF